MALKLKKLRIMRLSHLQKGDVVKIYKGSGNSSGDLLCNIQDNKVYKGGSNSSSDLLYNIKDNKVYKGGGYNSGDLLCNIKDNKVYMGGGYTSFDVICNLENNKVYIGGGSSSTDVLCNIRDNKVYQGTGHSSSDVLFNSTEYLGAEELVAILFTLGLLPPAKKSQRSYKNARTAQELGEMIGEDLAKVIGKFFNYLFRKIKEMIKK